MAKVFFSPVNVVRRSTFQFQKQVDEVTRTDHLFSLSGNLTAFILR